MMLWTLGFLFIAPQLVYSRTIAPLYDASIANFTIEEDLPSNVICSYIPDRGHCLGKYNMFSYHPIRNICEKIVYTGCGGNPNRFYSKKKCLETCASYLSEEEEFQILPEEANEMEESKNEDDEKDIWFEKIPRIESSNMTLAKAVKHEIPLNLPRVKNIFV